MSRVSLSENKEGGGRRRRRRSRRKPTNGAESKPWSQGDHDAVERALARFDQSPPPMGIPETIDPAPREKQLKWQPNAVPKKIQKKVGDIVCKSGEFGFLPEERVDEMVEARAAEMTVEEAQEINSKPDDSAEKDYNDEEVEEAIETAAEEAAEEAPAEEVAEPAEETPVEEAPAEEATPAPAPTWGDDEDPWADN